MSFAAMRGTLSGVCRHERLLGYLRVEHRLYSGRASRSQHCCVDLAAAAQRHTDKDSNDTDSDCDFDERSFV